MINPWSYAFILDSLGFESRASLKAFTSIYTGEKSDVEKRQPPAEQVQRGETPKANTVASP